MGEEAEARALRPGGGSPIPVDDTGIDLLRLAAGVLLPAAHDDVDVPRVELQQARAASEVLAGHERAAGAAEGVEDGVAGRWIPPAVSLERLGPPPSTQARPAGLLLALSRSSEEDIGGLSYLRVGVVGGDLVADGVLSGPECSWRVERGPSSDRHAGGAEGRTPMD